MAKPTPTTKPTPTAAQPASLVLDSPYAFYEDAGELRQWREGHTVTDADEIALLMERGAPVTVVEASNE